MDQYIPISTLNDFIFCPKSIYFHQLYGRYHSQVYKDTPQVSGTIAHSSIDTKTYSTSKNILQSLDVYSEKYWITGKIDIYDTNTQVLMDRKNRITTVYLGYIYQLYAQYLCMIEMWYIVKELKLWSKSDNKIHSIPIPNDDEILKFEAFLQTYRDFKPNLSWFTQNPHKCAKCIYRELCDFYQWS